MALTNWDPIEAGLSTDVVNATVKRQIRNILKSYTGWFDPLCELIQNAVDAVEVRKKKDETVVPTIWVRINLRDNIVSVTDNGIGFTEDQFRTFLAPNVSFKGRSDRGNKGVGATYLAYGFNHLQVGTKTPGFTFLGSIKNGREWLEDDAGTVIRPKMNSEAQAHHEAFDALVQGSTFSLFLEGEYIRPRDLKWVGASTAKQWETVLKIKTALGGVYFDRPSILAKCYLTVVDERGIQTQILVDNCSYIYPHTVISTCKDLSEIRQVQQRLIDKGEVASRLPDNFYKLNGLHASWNYNDVISEKGTLGADWSESEKELAEKYKVGIYGFLAYSTFVWDKYNDEIVGLRKKGRILKGGIQLATSCMPQGELVVIPLTKNIGYQNVTHVVVHFVQADTDLGRKGFQPELQNLAQHVGVAVVNSLTKWKHLLLTDTGEPPDIVSLKNIHDWIREQEEHEKTHPLVISRKDVFLPTKEPSMTSAPSSEQDVIALFNQLLAGGVIRGVKIMSTSQHQQYDGVFRFCLTKPFENHIFDKDTNPLGIDRVQIKQEFLSAPMILEYKYSFDGLIEEIERGDKNERQIHLVVAWEMGSNWKARYSVVPLLHFSNLQHRYFHGGTHIIKTEARGEHVFPALILSELINYINNPDGEQAYQSATYLE